MPEIRIGNAVIKHADALLPQEEAKNEKRAKADEINQKLAEIGAKKAGDLTLADINVKLDIILEQLGIR